MPQMAPILWLPLFIALLISTIILKTSIYFSFKPTSFIDNNMSTKKNFFNWKW